MSISPPPVALAAVLSAALFGCDALDPDAQAHRAYVRQLQPLLVENSLLADQVLTMAAGVYNAPDGDPAPLAATWSEDLVPVAEHLHSQATFVEPPAPWQEPHAELVDIWSDRAQAYRSISEAVTSADADQWKSARALADAVKLREEEWFRSANQVLAPRGLVLDQFP